MATNQLQIAIIIPIYNPPTHWEESCLAHMIALNSYLARYSLQFILINDGSDRNIFRHLRRSLKQINLHVKMYNLSTNQGKGKALKTGVLKTPATTKHYICVDWDFPFGIQIIGQIINQLESGHDLVLVDRGQDYTTKLPILRSTFTKIWRWFIKCILKLKIKDTQSGLKGFNQTAANIFTNCRTNSFFHDLEFVIASHRQQLSIATQAGFLRGGIQLKDFSFRTYLVEVRSLISILRQYYA